jgi:hypothetical protein
MSSLVVAAGQVRSLSPAAGDSVLIEDGRVSAIGSSEGLVGEDRIDFPGATIVPALQDHHFHPIGYTRAVTGLTLKEVPDFAALSQVIADEDRRLPAGAALIGIRLDDESLAEGRLPDRLLLDRAAPGRPVLLYRYCGHIAIASTTALEQAGLGTGVQDPEGGAFDRDASGAPNGILREEAIGRVSGPLSEMVPPIEPPAVAAALGGLTGLGLTRLTAIVSAGAPLWCGGSNEVDLLVEAAAGLNLKLDVLVVASTPEELGAAAQRLDQAGPNIRFAGWKEFADGGLGGRTAAMHEAFADAPGNRGILRLDLDRAEQMAEVALSMGGAVAIHAIGDLANDEVVSLFRRLLRRGADPAGLRIEHASVLTAEAIKQCGELGITVSVQPAFLASETAWLERRVGPDRLHNTYPFASLLEQRAALVGGSDCPVEPPNPWWGMAAARDRQGLADEQSLDAAQAMRLFAEPITPGSEDFLVVDRDPLAVSPGDLADTRVMATFVGGRLAEAPPELPFR